MVTRIYLINQSDSITVRRTVLNDEPTLARWDKLIEIII